MTLNQLQSATIERNSWIVYYIAVVNSRKPEYERALPLPTGRTS